METDFYSILKAVSMVATGLFGGLGILTNYKDKEGRVTKWGKVAITGICFSATISLVLYTLEVGKAKKANEEIKKQNKETKAKLDAALVETNRVMSLQRISLDKSQTLEQELRSTTHSLSQINVASREISRKQESVLKEQRKVLTAESRLRLWQIRGFYPLSPLTIHYSVVLPMDRPELAAYNKRILASISAQYKKRANIRNPHDQYPEDVIGEFMEMPGPYVPSLDTAIPLKGDDLPRYREEGWDNSALTRADIWFDFNDSKSTALLQILTYPNLDSSGDCKLSLSVNFYRRQFVQDIDCNNIKPRGDNLAFSSLDLIGKRMTWGAGIQEGSDWKLGYVSFSFQNQLESSEKINMQNQSGNKGILLTAKNLNLERILDAAKLPYPPP